MRFTKLLTLIVTLSLSALLLGSCIDEKPSFDEALLVGKWVSGTEYYRYDADHTGATWDTADDVSEEEAQPYTWEYDDATNALTLIHQMEMGGVVPKSYTITRLDATVLEYKDKFSQTFSYRRVE